MNSERTWLIDVPHEEMIISFAFGHDGGSKDATREGWATFGW